MEESTKEHFKPKYPDSTKQHMTKQEAREAISKSPKNRAMVLMVRSENQCAVYQFRFGYRNGILVVAFLAEYVSALKSAVV